jgi:hypothetical protein
MREELCRTGRRRDLIEGFVASAALAFALSACYPTLPPVFAEGTEVLPAGKVGLTLLGAGAGGATAQPNNLATLTTAGGGLEARVRIGLGLKQEIGVTGSAMVGTSNGGDPPFAAGASLAYKVAPVQWLALIANAGVLDTNAASVVVFGGDLGAVVAPYTAKDGSQLYTGLRGSFSIPVLTNQNAHAVNEALTVPIGYKFELGEHNRLFLEGGLLLGFTQLTHELTIPVTDSYTSYGGYGLVGWGHTF